MNQKRLLSGVLCIICVVLLLSFTEPVTGQIGVTTCTFATQANCPNFFPNSYCDVDNGLCKCPTVAGYVDDGTGTACTYACTFATQANCPNFLPNSYCDVDNGLCKCQTVTGYVDDGTGTACTYDCSSLTAPTNGDVSTADGTYTGDVATYTCNNGYKIVGTVTRTCVQDFGWSDTAPTCTEGSSGGKPNVYSELNFKRQGDASVQQEIIPYLTFLCNFTQGNDTEYLIEWEIDGTHQVTLGPGSDPKLMELHEDDLLYIIGDNNVHGTQIRCGVVNYLFDAQENGTIMYSDILSLGAEVKENVVYLNKTGTTYINIEFYVPVGCGYTVHKNEQPTFRCFYSLQMTSRDPWTCSKGLIANIVTDPVGNKFCTEPLKLLEKPEDWNHRPYVHTLEISTTDESYEDGEEYILELKFDDSISHRLWTNYVFPEIKVIVSDTKSNLNKICYSQVDPHMRSADSTYYEHQEIGTFIFYRNTMNKIEVQEKLKGCGGRYSRARCACAVAVRAGADVFMVNLCGSINFFGFTKCNDGGLLDVKILDQQRYQIITPTNSRIEIQINTFIPRTLNIVMYMSPKDKYHTEGECGEFDGDRSNDFKHKGGTFTSNSGSYGQSPDAFSESWEVSDEESLFLNPDMELETWENNNQHYCMCKRQGDDSSDSLCSRKQNFGCQEELSITRKKCKLSSRKRSVGGHYDSEMRRLFTLMTTDRAEREKREAAVNITEEEATTLCSALAESLVATNYSDISGGEDIQAVVSQCEMDVVEMNDPSMVQLHIDAINNIAKNILELTPSFVANNSEDVQYFLSNSCPNNCSKQGQCTEYGTCSCAEGYGGSDCSIDLSDPLTIDDIEGGGLCDTAAGEDCLCFTLRTDHLLEGFTCSINVFDVFADEIRKVASNVVVLGDYEDVFTGVCCLPAHMLTTTFANKLSFAISNVGINYGSQVDVYVYDSTCQTVNTTDNNIVSLMDGFCFIDGNCVEHLQSRTSANCSFCDTRNRTDKWIDLCPDLSDEEDRKVLIIALSVTFAVVGIIIMSALVMFFWKNFATKKIIPDISVESKMSPGYDMMRRTTFCSNTTGPQFGNNLNSQQLQDVLCTEDKPSLDRGLSSVEVEISK